MEHCIHFDWLTTAQQPAPSEVHCQANTNVLATPTVIRSSSLLSGPKRSITRGMRYSQSSSVFRTVLASNVSRNLKPNTSGYEASLALPLAKSQGSPQAMPRLAAPGLGRRRIPSTLVNGSRNSSARWCQHASGLELESATGCTSCSSTAHSRKRPVACAEYPWRRSITAELTISARERRRCVSVGLCGCSSRIRLALRRCSSASP
mmetsp:Transcript_14595/g.40306  ORF Transcript_14595/g.40306 Transcript_14595/m.40306 type:complete len:206 (-) Transcript_14595:534-1151(-)